METEEGSAKGQDLSRLLHRCLLLLPVLILLDPLRVHRLVPSVLSIHARNLFRRIHHRLPKKAWPASLASPGFSGRHRLEMPTMLL